MPYNVQIAIAIILIVLLILRILTLTIKNLYLTRVGHYLVVLIVPFFLLFVVNIILKLV